MKHSISETLRLIAAVPKENRAEALRQNGTQPILTVLQYCFHPLAKWLLPEGPVPYKPMDAASDVQGALWKEARRLYIFVDGGNPNLNQRRREMLYIQLLEQIDPSDAELMVAIKDKTMPIKGITYALVREAFPDLLPEEPETPVVTKKEAKAAKTNE